MNNDNVVLVLDFKNNLKRNTNYSTNILISHILYPEVDAFKYMDYINSECNGYFNILNFISFGSAFVTNGSNGYSYTPTYTNPAVIVNDVSDKFISSFDKIIYNFIGSSKNYYGFYDFKEKNWMFCEIISRNSEINSSLYNFNRV